MPGRTIQTNILAVDDDRITLELFRRNLTPEFKLTTTHKSTEAVALAKQEKPDLIILDAEMPELDGFELSKLIRKDTALSKTPVIIISGKRISEEEIIDALDIGADDYLLKPISFPLLKARINAVMRRYRACQEKAERIKKLGLEISPQSRMVKVNNKLAILTRKEFDLLTILISREGHILDIPFLLENIWGYDPANYNDPHTIEVHISNLRKKLGPKLSKHIVTVSGHGYKFQ